MGRLHPVFHPTGDDAASEAAVLAAFEALEAAFDRRDPQAVLDLFADDPDVRFFGSGAPERAEGKAELAALLAVMASWPGSFRVRYHEREVHLRGDVAWVVAEGQASWNGGDVTVTELPYRASGVLVRVEGRWRWHTYHGSEPAALDLPSPPAESIATDSIRLERLSVAHLEGMMALIGDPEVLRFTRVPSSASPDFAHTWLARYENGRRDGTREGFAVVDAVEGRFLGVATAPRIEREARTVELGYVIAPAARGRGVATAALAKLTEWAFSELGARRVELLISVDNPASKRVARRCGYRLEGVLRSVYLKQDIWSDTEIWSRLPTDP
jgi:uncharacterized protein (TIGR02246 family)